MKNLKLNIWLLCAPLALFVSCASEEPNGDSDDDQIRGIEIIEVKTSPEFNLTKAEAQVNQGMSDFSLEFFKTAAGELCEIRDNFMVSPISASMFLGLVANSADPQTQSNICSRLGADDIDCLNSANRKLMEYLPDASNQSIVELANSVWHAPYFEPSESFTTRLSQSYYAEVTPLDFSEESAPDIINKWCYDKTHGLIGGIVDEIDPTTLLFWVNAIYFKSAWEYDFIEKATAPAVFNGIESKATVDMMHSMINMRRYYAAENYASVTLPYKGNNEMIVILPNEGVKVADVISSLTMDELQKTIDSQKEEVAVSMPKFESDSEFPCGSIFGKLGFNLLTVGCDAFNGVDYIDDAISVMQKSVIKVSEKGTEAAAVTGGIITSPGEDSEPSYINFVCDRPFIYLIRNTVTGSILMAGQFAQPK